MTRRVRCSDAGSSDTTEADRATRPEKPGLPPPTLPERPGLLPPRPWSPPPPRTSVDDPPFAHSCAVRNGGREKVHERQTIKGTDDADRGRA